MSDQTEPHSPQQQIEYLQAKMIAHSLILKALVPAILPDGALRAQVRDNICTAVERMYEDAGLKPHAHYILQAALDEVEGLFTFSSDQDRMTNLQR